MMWSGPGHVMPRGYKSINRIEAVDQICLISMKRNLKSSILLSDYQATALQLLQCRRLVDALGM